MSNPDSNRLDRMEGAIDNLRSLVVDLREGQAVLQQGQAALQSSVSQVVQTVGILADVAQSTITRMDGIQSQVLGLQTQVNRILERMERGE